MAPTEQAPKDPTLRSVSVNGSIFWLLVSAVALIYTALGLYLSFARNEYVALSEINAIVDIALAYEAWKQRRTAFLIGWLLSSFNAVASFLLQGALTTIGVLVIMSQLMVAFYCSQAYQELRPDRVPRKLRDI